MTRTPSHFLGALAALFVAATAQAQPFTFNGGGGPIPDNNPIAPFTNTINVTTQTFPVGSVAVLLNFGPEHTFAGDLVATLTHGTTTVDLFRRVGRTSPLAGFGHGSDLNGAYTFTDAATQRLTVAAGAVTPAQDVPTGSYRATTNLFNGLGGPDFLGETVVNLNAAFLNQPVNGNWTLTVSDNAATETGSIASWSLIVTPVPEPSALALTGLGLALAAWRRRARAA